MFALLVLSAICLILILTLLIKWYNHVYKYSMSGIPGPKPLPLLGNALSFGFNPKLEILERLATLAKKYGGIFKLYQGTRTVLVILTDPVYMKPILNSSTHLNKSEMYDNYAPFIGNGLIITSAAHWKGNRKLLSPSFNYSMLEKFNEVFNSASNRLIANLQLKQGNKIDIYEYVNISALDIIFECVMGMKMSERLEEQLKYMKNIDNFLKIAMDRAFSFFKRNEFFFKLTPDYKKQEIILSELREITTKQIKYRMKQRKRNENGTSVNELNQKNKQAILDCLLDVYSQDELPMEYIKQEVDTFLLAGHHTVSRTMAFLIYELSKHSDIQDKIFKETNSILGDSREVFITMQQSNDMKYLESVVKEGLRLYPPGPLFERILETDVEINGVIIPKGTTINFLVFAMHRSEKLYPDPLKFDPERFNAENSAARDPYAFLPFSAGPRICLGWRFAMLESKCTLAKIIREFKICEADPDFRLELCSDGILKSNNGYPVLLQPRY